MKEEYKKALLATNDALKKIKRQLKPFIKQLDSDDAADRAQAQAVVSLSLGTLRYMNKRLEGKDEGRAKDDPLRQELDRMKHVLLQLEKKRKAETAKISPSKRKRSDRPDEGQKPPTDSSAGSKIRKAEETKPKKSRLSK